MANPGWRGGKRPQHCPRVIKRKWPGITYPAKTYLQARCWPHNVEISDVFHYKDYGGDVIATHKAAEAWLAEHRVPRRATLNTTAGYVFSVGATARSNTGVAGVSYSQQFDKRDGIYKYSFSVTDEDGSRRRFFCGTENTWTQERENEAFAAACALRAKVETKRLKGMRARGGPAAAKAKALRRAAR